MDLRDGFSTDTAKKILGNEKNARDFLLKLQSIKGFELPVREITRGPRKGERVLDLKTAAEVWAKIVEYWDFEEGQKIIRKLFKKTPKYQSGKESYETMQVLLAEWDKLKLADISWPFSQGDFDGFVQRVNSEEISGLEKDAKVKLAAVKYRRIKEINTVRNDFIETLIFEKHQNILPTLNHRRSVDFFINGISFDQKVSKSPTGQFQKKFGEDWKSYAIEHPEVVAEYLYKYQDEGRFGHDCRLLVVYLDEDVTIERIASAIDNIDLETPLEINFEYKHKDFGKKNYKTKCFVILLHKEVAQ